MLGGTRPMSMPAEVKPLPVAAPRRHVVRQTTSENEYDVGHELEKAPPVVPPKPAKRRIQDMSKIPETNEPVTTAENNTTAAQQVESPQIVTMRQTSFSMNTPVDDMWTVDTLRHIDKPQSSGARIVRESVNLMCFDEHATVPKDIFVKETVVYDEPPTPLYDEPPPLPPPSPVAVVLNDDTAVLSSSAGDGMFNDKEKCGDDASLFDSQYELMLASDDSSLPSTANMKLHGYLSKADDTISISTEAGNHFVTADRMRLTLTHEPTTDDLVTAAGTPRHGKNICYAGRVRIGDKRFRDIWMTLKNGQLRLADDGDVAVGLRRTRRPNSLLPGVANHSPTTVAMFERSICWLDQSQQQRCSS
jgi:hypothetical protein